MNHGPLTHKLLKGLLAPALFLTALTLSSARVQYNKSPPKFPLSPPAYIVFSTLLI